MSAPRSVLLKIVRSGPGNRTGRADTFQVPTGPRATVLDALLAVRRLKDPSLTFRHSCLHGSCGTCGMRVNGREALACVTRLDGLGDPVVVEPLAGAPVVGDLVVDMSGFYRRLEPAGRPLVRASEARGRPDAPTAAPASETGPVPKDLERFEDCIECGLCLSACPIAGDPRFLGPAALAGAERVLDEPRGADLGAVRGWVDDAHGAWRCHAAFECSTACPVGVEPGAAIMRLRGRLLRDRLPRLVGRYHREGRT